MMFERRYLIPLAALFLMGAGDGTPPLVAAMKNADRDALRLLLQQRASVNAAEADGTTALHWASYRDDVESADLLIRAGANVNAANDLGATPLWTASLNASAPMVKRLLDAGANPNIALLAGETPLMVAFLVGYAVDAFFIRLDALISRFNAASAPGQRGDTAAAPGRDALKGAAAPGPS
jgi:ankyrin repeat protein